MFSSSQLSSSPVASSGSVSVSSLDSVGASSSQIGNVGPTSTGQQPQSSAPAILPEVSTLAGMYIEQDCYVDSGGNGYPLVGAISFDVTTVTECINDCAPGLTGAYHYAGVEGTKCYCSNTFNANALSDTAACTQACPGDLAHICGGGTGLGGRSGGGLVLYFVKPLFSEIVPTNEASASQFRVYVELGWNSGHQLVIGAVYIKFSRSFRLSSCNNRFRRV